MFYTYTPEAPGAFALSRPLDGDRVHNDTVTVSWMPSIDPDPGDVITFNVEWSTDSTFTAFNSDTTSNLNYTITFLNGLLDELPDDTLIYWRVKAVDNYGLYTWGSNDSTGWSFGVDVYQAPTSFGLLTPANGDTMWILEANLTWELTDVQEGTSKAKSKTKSKARSSRTGFKAKPGWRETAQKNRRS